MHISIPKKGNENIEILVFSPQKTFVKIMFLFSLPKKRKAKKKKTVVKMIGFFICSIKLDPS